MPTPSKSGGLPKVHVASFANLGGLEQAIPPKSPTYISSTLEWNNSFEGVLMTARRSSSVYSREQEELIDSYTDRSPRDKALPPRPYSFWMKDLEEAYDTAIELAKPVTPYSYTVRSTSDSIIESGRVRDQKPQIASSVVELVENAKWRQEPCRQSPTKISSRGVHSQSAPVGTLNGEFQARPAIVQGRTTSDLAGVRMKALPPLPRVSLASTISYVTDPPIQLSATITEVANDLFITSPLSSYRPDGGNDSPAISSFGASKGQKDYEVQQRYAERLSCDDINIIALRSRTPYSIVKENQRKLKENHYMMTIAAVEQSATSQEPSSPELRLPPSHGVAKHTNTIEPPLSHMYENANTFSTRIPDLSSSSEQSLYYSPFVQRERSAAVSITRYQHAGVKAWGNNKLAKEPKEHLSFLAKRRTKKNKLQEEARRQELKKQILVLGPHVSPSAENY